MKTQVFITTDDDIKRKLVIPDDITPKQAALVGVWTAQAAAMSINPYVTGAGERLWELACDYDIAHMLIME